jgi:deoxyribonuclease-1
MRILRGVLASLGNRIAKLLDADKRRSPARRVSQSLHSAEPTVCSGLFCDTGLVTLKLSYKIANNDNTNRGNNMRAVVVALTYLAACGAVNCAQAGGQTQLNDPKASAGALFWNELYPTGGVSLYCGKGFSDSHKSLMASPVYSSKQIKSALRCTSEQQCLESNPQYLYMQSDLHNLYPELTRVELARRGAQFGKLDSTAKSEFDDISCSLKASYQIVEPRDEAKGNVARAIFYMHSEYGLPIFGQVQLFKQWHQMDPPDAAELARNDKVFNIQGNRNRFIDDPSQVELLIKD